MERRLRSSSSFDYADPLNETVLLGTLAVRMQNLNRKLQWDGPNMRITNINSRDVIRILTKNIFEVTHGNPNVTKEYSTLIAPETAEEWIRHTYRQGWEQI